MKNIQTDDIEIGDECYFKDGVLLAKKAEGSLCNGCYFYNPLGNVACEIIVKSCLTKNYEYIIYVKQ